MKYQFLIVFFIITFQLSISVASHRELRTLTDPNYGTHMVPLLTIVAHTAGPILELGCGDFSTPLLHAVCRPQKRYLLSTDTSKEWLDLFLDLETQWHHFQYVPVYENDWDSNPKPELWNLVGQAIHWSVVLVDHRPGERRIIDIIRLREHADIFVVHDTQQETYGYELVLNTFKYQYVYKRYATTTTIVSDNIDISSFFHESTGEIVAA